MKTKVKLNASSLIKKLDEMAKLDAVRTVVIKNTGRLKDRAHLNAEPGKIFTKGYSEGNIRDSLIDTLEVKGNKITGIVGTPMKYAPYVEYGTRFMEAEPFMKPAFDDTKDEFLSDLKKVMK